MIVIDAPIERVWAELADVAGQARWMHEMKAIRDPDDGPIERRHDVRGGRPDVRHQRHRPGDDHRVRPAPSLRHQPRRHVQGRRARSPSKPAPTARRPSSTGTRLLIPPVLPHLGALVDGADARRDLPGRPRSASRSSSRRAPRPAERRASDSPTVQLHLVDATYELFRAHFAPRPPVLGRDGIPLSGVSGLCDQLLFLLREQGATHVGCATDRVIESFRNDLFPGYKSSAGMPPELLAQFPIAEAAVEALGIVLWPMVEFEADDAIARRRRAVRRRPARSSGSSSARPTRTWPSSSSTTGSCSGTGGATSIYDDAGVREKWGVAPDVDPRLARPRRRLVGRLPRASPAGAPSPRPRSSTRYGHYEDDPAEGVGVGGAGRRRVAGDDAWPPPCATTGTRRCCTATWPGSGPSTTASRSASTTPTSCAGTARHATSGRRSARNGASTGSDRGPIAGCAETERRLRASGLDQDVAQAASPR